MLISRSVTSAILLSAPQLLSAFQLSPNTIIVNIASLTSITSNLSFITSNLSYITSNLSSITSNLTSITSNLPSCTYRFPQPGYIVSSPGCPQVAVLQLPGPAPPHCLEVKNN